MLDLEKMQKVEAGFAACQKMLTAFGDEMRQKILMLMVMGDPQGVRVAEIAERTTLTRPAVSHHMQILKDAGVVKSRKEGNQVYYYFNAQEKNMDVLIRLFEDVRSILKCGGNPDV